MTTLVITEMRLHPRHNPDRPIDRAAEGLGGLKMKVYIIDTPSLGLNAYATRELAEATITEFGEDAERLCLHIQEVEVNQ
jgi:hypothetical protein